MSYALMWIIPINFVDARDSGHFSLHREKIDGGDASTNESSLCYDSFVVIGEAPPQLGRNAGLIVLAHGRPFFFTTNLP
ncbi:MAG: hypothetical protein APF80_07265 [Alphaproteobacteria bacterium BRH_c36]|nr:MAG: hypothetical protein APF80_07265 [Alphaproteobacteria bacterium BRH_c36]